MEQGPALSASDQADYDAFKRLVLKRSGVDLDQYKQQQMHRRLQGMVARTNASSFADYFLRIESDPAEWAAFLDRVTINVSELFRNVEKWDEVRRVVLPELLARSPRLRLWSAGCSIGAEPYTLAMILDSLTPGARHTLTATDIDAAALEKARAGVFEAGDVRSVPAGYSEPYLLKRGRRYEVVPALRQRVTFKKHNLLADRFEGGWDFIACRNVVIYFTDEAKASLFRRLAQALRVHGMLFLGCTERIADAREIGLEPRLPFFYERAR